MNDRRTRTKIAGVVLALGALLVAGYLIAVFLTRKTVVEAGRSIASGVLGTEITEQPLPPGSVLLLDNDTLGTLVAVGRLNSSSGKDSLHVFAGHLHSGTDQNLRATDKMVAIRQQEFTANQPEIMRLVATSSISGRSPRGRLVLRATKDSSVMRTFAVY